MAAATSTIMEVNIRGSRIVVSGDTVQLTAGGARANIPIAMLDDVIRMLEGTRFLLGGSAGTAAKTPAGLGLATGASPAPPIAAIAPSGAKKRRSRKRVGDALIGWMEANPGWHSEQRLLEVVIANKMTDASPKRALKIALGKQRDEIFEGDGHGNWKLVSDKAAGAAPAPAPKEHKRSGRKPKLTAKARGTGRKRLKTRPRSNLSERIEPQGEQDSPEARTVLVKRGEDRKLASLPPGELEAREEASSKLTRRNKRWGGATPDEVERARRNLLGLGPAAPKAPGRE